MLRQLYIKNYALIDELDIAFRSGFSVITGETGAGKSIILGAIGLLLGQRADSKTVKSGADRCVIEAHFDLTNYPNEDFFAQNDIEADAPDTIIRRELTSQGKSRAFINDTPVPLTLLKELGERLVDVHSQHQNLLLGKHDFQLGVVDVIANSAAALSDYKKAWTDYQTAARQLETLREEIAQNSRNADFLQFQYDELSAAKLCDGEQEELEQRSDTMTHAEDIKSALYVAATALDADDSGIVGQLKKATAALQSIASVLPGADELAERMDSSYIELKDVAAEISGKLEGVDFDPSELDAVNARLDRIYELEKKYKAETVAQLLAIQNDLRVKLSNIENGGEALAELTAEVDRRMAQCRQKADTLSEQRRKGAAHIDQQMLKRLVPLGMPHVRFQTQIEKGELTHNGQDRVAFLFSANTSTAMQPVSQVASGGEIARVMLSLKAMISGAVKLPTIIFDEIDTGVSGKIAEQMAQIMAEMGSCGRQVISITHLPQIAALGSTHYKVYKEETQQGTTSHMLMLDDEERVTEIAQMLSGSNVTAAAVENARQLLKN
ncbi:MAG: DNA repair protein RecN [Prevotella sp.]|nr:DNA repair protein RecN [Prevotella sp.]